MTKGLTNLGNTCYMNSALQCLTHLDSLQFNNELFIEDIRKRSSKNDDSLIKEWLSFQKEIWINTDNQVVNTRSILINFMELCRKNNYYFESFVQNDSQEFINLFIDLLHNSIKRKVRIEVSGEAKNDYDLMKIKSIESWKTFFESNYSYIIKNFYSKLVSHTQCPECNYKTTNYEPICTITLPLNKNHGSIYDSLNEYVDTTMLDNENTWKCDHCKQMVQSIKKCEFLELSPVLIFCMKQFRKGIKINHHIDFPETITMNNYCINKNQNYQYRLKGVSIHSGGLHGGHYYAMCRSKNGKWYNCNDSSVSEVSLETVLSETPYCLFYERI